MSADAFGSSGTQSGLFARLYDLDIFPKVDVHFSKKTATGGTLSVTATVLVCLLLFYETGYYLRGSQNKQLEVVKEIDHHMNITIDISVPKMRCAVLSMDVLDSTGAFNHNVLRNVYKYRIAKDGTTIDDEIMIQGKPRKGPAHMKGSFLQETGYGPTKLASGKLCGPCYGAEYTDTECCNTCKDVQRAFERRGWTRSNGYVRPEDLPNVYQCRMEDFYENMESRDGEGCRLKGHIEINKADGALYIAPGNSYETASGQHVHDLFPFMMATGKKHERWDMTKVDVSHTIHELHFGEGDEAIQKRLDTPSPLNGQKRLHEGVGAHHYFLRLVPSRFEEDGETAASGYQVAAIDRFVDMNPSHHRPIFRLPGIFISWEISPIRVVYSSSSEPFVDFLVSVLAVAAGVVTLARFFDAIIFSTGEKIRNLDEARPM